jgi:hypothetical protein
MDFWQTVLVLFRRWYVALPTFVGSLALAGLAYTLVPTQYESGCVLALTTPLTGGTHVTADKRPPALTNPLTNFDAGLSMTGTLIIQEINSAATAKSLGVTPGGGTGYDVNNGSTNPELLQTGPFIFVTGVGSTPAAAEGITEQVAVKVGEVLALRQEQLMAPDSTHIELQRVVPVTDGEPLAGNASRAAAASLALAVLASLAAVYGFESFATRVRRRDVAGPPPSGRGSAGSAPPEEGTARQQTPESVHSR